ncbi:RNA-directed DNA polymerase, eukaryota, Reverse transcriptase zinc-binding domain protein [Artemisia annua]|uniref:RNA-directed DNA polymerase, eukaryota, Reverse transcriptase zinc-binding domain protein n=1 Tax=Artemisia annua TaxID=35608 RepID=A0A2U1PEF8_ARTAN|nr:RNA-directed DNA polymerase, eukaryota, Reverse transcriptase zinc-binding domain protein [Artemisia annua]
MEDQVIHTCIRFKIDKRELFCSFVYAHNRYIQRRPLWRNLIIHKHYVRDRPGCLLGDFNSALNLEDRVEGTSVIDIAMREFKECVEEIEVFDVNRSGLQFTWNQKPRGTDGKLKKIDRIMANLACMDGFVGVHAIFQPYRISDHAPAILTIPTSHKFTPRPFKFYNILVQNSQFKVKVKESWEMDVSGFHMYKVVSKLKSLKKPLRKLLYNEGNIHDKVVKLRHELDTNWIPNTRLEREKITKVPVWVLIHNVPAVAYSEVGIGLIAQQLGRIIRMDSLDQKKTPTNYGRIPNPKP